MAGSQDLAGPGVGQNLKRASVNDHDAESLVARKPKATRQIPDRRFTGLGSAQEHRNTEKVFQAIAGPFVCLKGSRKERQN